MARLGMKVEPIRMLHTDYAIACYYIICTAEASSNLARYDGVRYGFRESGADDLREMYKKTRDHGFGAEVKRRIMLGTYVLSSGYYDAYYRKAQKVRALITRDFLEAFDKVDILVTPTSPVPAFKLGERMDDPLQMYLADIYTVTASLAGVPGISVPCGVTRSSPHLPVGMQILANHFDEARLLRVAHRRGEKLLGDLRVQLGPAGPDDMRASRRRVRIGRVPLLQLLRPPDLRRLCAPGEPWGVQSAAPRRGRPLRCAWPHRRRSAAQPCAPACRSRAPAAARRPHAYNS